MFPRRSACVIVATPLQSHQVRSYSSHAKANLLLDVLAPEDLSRPSLRMPEACYTRGLGEAAPLCPEEDAGQITKHPRRHKQVAKSSGDDAARALWRGAAMCTSSPILACRACDNLPAYISLCRRVTCWGRYTITICSIQSSLLTNTNQKSAQPKHFCII